LFLYDLKAAPEQPQPVDAMDVDIQGPSFTMDSFVQDIVAALRNTNNNNSQAAAQDRMAAHAPITNSSAQQQAQQTQQAQQSAQRQEEDEDLEEPVSEDVPGIEVLTSMGFSEKQSRRALLINSLDTELALNWLLEHADDPEDSPTTQTQARSMLSSLQQLQAVQGTSIAKRIEKSIKDKKCTFTVTGRDYAAQAWYHCYSCGLVDGEGVCESCAAVCHKGHKLSDKLQAGSFYCDCGAGAYACLCNQ